MNAPQRHVAHIVAVICSFLGAVLLFIATDAHDPIACALIGVLMFGTFMLSVQRES